MRTLKVLRLKTKYDILIKKTENPLKAKRIFCFFVEYIIYNIF